MDAYHRRAQFHDSVKLDAVIAAVLRDEQKRCIEICEKVIAEIPGRSPEATTARSFVEDCIERIRERDR